MKKSGKKACLIAAVMGMSLVPVLPAAAQVRVQQDGRAADANTRVGSGGYNDAVRPSSVGNVTPNQIFYGNVTGGREFRGPVAERDPRAFMGPIGGRLEDVFIKQSTAAPQPYEPQVDVSMPTPYFGSTRGVAPPVGTVREGFTGSYLGTPLTPQSELDLSSQFSSAMLNDWRGQPLGRSSILGMQSNALGVQPGELVLQGPLEANNQATLFTGSPLYGIRQYRAGEQPTDTGSNSLYGGPTSDRFHVDEATIRQMRSELQNPSVQQQSSNTQDQGNNLQNNSRGQSGQENLNQSFESPDNTAVDRRIDTSRNQGALSNGTNTNQGIQRRFATPQQQSAQYDELQRRMQRYENPQVAEIEQNHQFHMEQQRQARGGPTPHPTSRPGNLASSLSPQALQRAALPAQQAKPLKVTSLATGVRFAGLRDLMTRAEELMKQNKFQSAIETYDSAQKVAPNNWMIRLGRANAELGGGFYSQASEDIHEAYAYAPALMLGQYDLNAMMSPQRVQFVTRELKDLAAKNPKDEVPVFLLAYIHYNTGDEAQAAQYLSQAEERSEGKDVLLKLLRARWYMPQSCTASPTGGVAGDLNK